ncbi:MAG: hypothetical protein KDA80_23340 [Planctomycetaceae bacterium]|nr:hypothetical protein [Planctomycetaceae bacterium]
MTNPIVPANQRKAMSRGMLAVMGTQILLVLVGVSWGAMRIQLLREERASPIPIVEPLTVTPLYDRPEVVSDEQLAVTLDRLKPRLRGPQPKINWVDHALRFWGVEATFSEPECLSGREMRELLLDHRTFRDSWGAKERPFLVPDLSGSDPRFSFRTQSGQATASHVDHTLAGLAEVGTPLDYPVLTPAGEFPLRAAFDESFHEFSLNQREYEWSALAYIHYLPKSRTWITSEGQRVSWDLLADRMMRQRLDQGVCFGFHRLHALVVLIRVDDEHSILSSDARTKILDHLKDATQRLVTTQHADGYWDGSWPGDDWDGPIRPKRGPLGLQADRLLATGHALEWWALAPSEVLPPTETLRNAGHWVVSEIGTLSDQQVNSYYPFLSHAGRALALWRGKFPHEFLPLSERLASHGE